MQHPEQTRFTTDTEQLEALRVPFPVSEVKTRDQGGAVLHYYEAYAIQQRLLDVLGTGLNIRTGQVIATESNVNVETILEIEWASGRRTTISGWGSSDILLGKNGRLANDPYKTAATDSIKVAASKLGVAAELYDSKYRDGLAAKLKEQEDREAERAFLTCQDCAGEIRGGARKNADGNELALSAKQVATSTRKQLGRRLCIPCATAAAENKRMAEGKMVQ